MIEDAEIIKFQHLYKKHFGISLNQEEALEKAIALYRTVELTYKPMTVEEFEGIQARQL